jgi:hypothetical protein
LIDNMGLPWPVEPVSFEVGRSSAGRIMWPMSLAPERSTKRRCWRCWTARCRRAGGRAGDEITEREATFLLADFAMVWNELFPAEQARIVQLLVQRVDVKRMRWRCGSGPRGW